MQFTWAALATLISISISTIITLYVTRRNSKTQEFAAINSQINELLKISIQYPKLEHPSFTSSWNENRINPTEDYIRYDNYCTMVFNCLERTSKFFNHKEDEIQKFINMKDWIRLHKQNWSSPSVPHENADSYSTEFVNLVEKMIR